LVVERRVCEKHRVCTLGRVVGRAERESARIDEVSDLVADRTVCNTIEEPAMVAGVGWESRLESVRGCSTGRELKMGQWRSSIQKHGVLGMVTCI
jgi:hypothetical protein